MKRTFLLIVFALLVLSACWDSAGQKGTWIPALEDTGFTHLKTTGESLEVSLKNLRANMDKEQWPEARQSLAEAEEKVRTLLYYDIPITEVRQLIYDAGRFHALDRHDETLEYLNRADKLLGDIGKHGNPSLREAIQTPRLMIEKLREVLDQEHLATSTKYRVEISHSVAEQFSALGHKVNMMAIKGGLLLYGTNFNPQQQDAK